MQDQQKKPVLIIVSGLSGSGKSTTAKALASVLPNTVYMDSDETHKEMFGVPPTQKLPPEAYSPEGIQDLIRETDSRIMAHLAAGRNVILSVMLVSDEARNRQETRAAEAGADFQGIWLKTDSKTMLDRVAARKGDASDASLEFVAQQSTWEIGTVTWPVIDAGLSRQEVLKQALDILQPKISPPEKSAQKPAAPSPKNQ